MAAPITIAVPKDVWTKVATKVKVGTIQKCSTVASHAPTVYLQTYRMNLDAAPTQVSEGAKMFIDSKDTETEMISASEDIDVYCMALGADGELRVNA